MSHNSPSQEVCGDRMFHRWAVINSGFLLWFDFQPLVERFETFCLDPSLVTKQANLVHFPPGFQPIPCKPLFFDLALNHVAFPPLEDKLEQKAKSGLTGYIKGIFGFRS